MMGVSSLASPHPWQAQKWPPKGKDLLIPKTREYITLNDQGADMIVVRDLEMRGRYCVVPRSIQDPQKIEGGGERSGSEGDFRKLY